MKLRNLVILDDIVNDFKFFKLKSSPSPSYLEPFSNMCEDLTLENGKKYVDNELLKGYTCEDYSKHGLCEDKKPTRIYFEDIMNLNNLSPKDACCVCGGGKTTTSNSSESTESSESSQSSQSSQSSESSQSTESSQNSESAESSKSVENCDKSNNNKKRHGRSIIQFKPTGTANIFLPEMVIN